MLAWTDPTGPLDAGRLSEFSAKPENSHGALNDYRSRRVERLKLSMVTSREGVGQGS